MHVAGIMRCASVLLDSQNLDINNNTNDKLTDEEVYDAPRALTRVPVRRENNSSEENDDEKVEDDWMMNGIGESKAVMQSEGVKSKMVKSADGKESFFSVVTKR